MIYNLFELVERTFVCWGLCWPAWWVDKLSVKLIIAPTHWSSKFMRRHGAKVCGVSNIFLTFVISFKPELASSQFSACVFLRDFPRIVEGRPMSSSHEKAHSDVIKFLSLSFFFHAWHLQLEWLTMFVSLAGYIAPAYFRSFYSWVSGHKLLPLHIARLMCMPC